MKAYRLLPLLFMGCLSSFAENRLLPLAPPAGFTSLTFQDLSADGRTALGMASGGSSNRVCTWSADTTGFSIIRGIADTEVHGASALSGDGATVLGYSPDPADGNNSRPWIYRGGTLSQLSAPGTYEKPSARELSFDGAVVVGMVDVDLAANVFAFRPAYWNVPPGGGQSFTLLSAEPEFQVQGWLDVVDPAGRYLFGDYLVYAAPASYDHYRYDRLSGSNVLLTNVNNVSLEDSTADGSVMVYRTYQNRLEQWNDDQSKQIFEYRPSEGFTGYRYIYGGMTADASRIFGMEEQFSAFGGGTTGGRLVYWDADRNLHDFTELFDGTSVDTNGWNFGLVGGRIYGVSTNGMQIVGRAHYNGQLTAFYLEVDPGAPPAFVIQNIAAAQREGSKLVDIYYDLSNAALNAAEISVAIRDGGAPVGATNLTGDVGASVVTGAMKHMVWDAGADWNGTVSELQYSVYATGEATNAFTTASTDTRDYMLVVNSAYGSPVPAAGTHSSYSWKSTITASVDAVAMSGGTNFTCAGWSGSGITPALGGGTNIVFTLVEPVTTVNWNWIEDLDLDGLPGDWELLYYGTETGAVAHVDTDGDGYTAWQEYILGSNPTNQGSSFLFTPGTNPPPGEFSVDFTTVAGRLYTVECTDDLASGLWQVLTNFIGDGSTTQIIDPANIPTCFYQIRIDWAGGSYITAPLARTGQVTSYQSGDDGDLQTGVVWPAPRFTVTGNGTAIDNLTGLEWVLDPSGIASTPISWSNALVTCSSLAYAGGDWRLPSYKELCSLIDYANGASGTPALPLGHPFTGVSLGNSYWTGSSFFESPDVTAMVVLMNYGLVTPNSKASAPQLIWPVRGGSNTAPAPVARTGQTISYLSNDDGDLQSGVQWPSPRFSDTGKNTVIDNLTGLEWINNPHSIAGNTANKSWSNAVDFCEGLDYASQQDWRLPNIREMDSIVTSTTNSPAGWLNGPDTPINGISSVYWTSTSYMALPTHAWIVDTLYFSETWIDKSYQLPVWPVRTAK